MSIKTKFKTKLRGEKAKKKITLSIKTKFKTTSKEEIIIVD